MKKNKKDITKELQNMMEKRYFETKRIICPECKSYDIVKNGNRKTTVGKKQRYKCKNCNYRFTQKYRKLSDKLINSIMELNSKGFSLRKIRDTINELFNTKIHHMTVSRWIKRGNNEQNL